METKEIKVNDKVRHIHPYDGYFRAGKPVGPVLIVIERKKHRPIDGLGVGYICMLSDGKWEFEWNIVPAGRESMLTTRPAVSSIEKEPAQRKRRGA